MSPALAAARLHGVTAVRPRSTVFHVYTGPLTATGRTPRGRRPVCMSRTRPLTHVERLAMAFDLEGLRLCGRCSARLTATARRAEQPPSNLDRRRDYFAGLTIADLFTAAAVAATVEDTHAVGLVVNLLHGHVMSVATRRPQTVSPDRWELERALLARRDHLRVLELPAEQRAAAEKARADRTADDARIVGERRKAAAMDRAHARANRGRYLTPSERDLLGIGRT